MLKCSLLCCTPPLKTYICIIIYYFKVTAPGGSADSAVNLVWGPIKEIT